MMRRGAGGPLAFRPGIQAQAAAQLALARPAAHAVGNAPHEYDDHGDGNDMEREEKHGGPVVGENGAGERQGVWAGRAPALFAISLRYCEMRSALRATRLKTRA